MPHFEKLKTDASNVVKLFESFDGKVAMLTRGQRPPALLGTACGCEQHEVRRGSHITKLCDGHAIECGLKQQETP